jgi:hypothetical protein
MRWCVGGFAAGPHPDVALLDAKLGRFEGRQHRSPGRRSLEAQRPAARRWLNRRGPQGVWRFQRFHVATRWFWAGPPERSRG